MTDSNRRDVDTLPVPGEAKPGTGRVIAASARVWLWVLLGVGGYGLLASRLGWYAVLVFGAVTLWQAWLWRVRSADLWMAGLPVNDAEWPGGRVRRLSRELAIRAGVPAPDTYVLLPLPTDKSSASVNPRLLRQVGPSASALHLRRRSLVLVQHEPAQLGDAHLRAVLAHEISHLRPAAQALPSEAVQALTRSVTVSAIVGSILTLGSAVFGSVSVASALFTITQLALLVPMARAYRAAASRSGEYLADQDAALLTDPASAAAALSEIHYHAFHGWRPPTRRELLFASHPTVQRRIGRLQRLHSARTGSPVAFPVPPESHNASVVRGGSFEEFRKGFREASEEASHEETEVGMGRAAVAAWGAVLSLVVTPPLYVSWMALLWLTSLPTGRAAIPLGVLFTAAFALPGVLSKLRVRRAIRKGPAWDAIGQPAWPGRRREGLFPTLAVVFVAEVVAVLAAWRAGIGLWDPVIACWVAAYAMIHWLTSRPNENTQPLVRLPGRVPEPDCSASGRQRMKAQKLINLTVGFTVVVLVASGQDRFAIAVAATGVAAVLAFRLLWPVRPIGYGEPDGTLGGPPPPDYKPVPPRRKRRADATGQPTNLQPSGSSTAVRGTHRPRRGKRAETHTEMKGNHDERRSD